MKELSTRRKKFIFDVGINLFSTGLNILVLQLVIHPMIARLIDETAYGEMQSVMSIVYIIAGTLGSSLCTSRLIQDYNYTEKNISGDFKVLFFVELLVVFILMPIILKVYVEGIDITSVILITCVALLNFTCNYLVVGLRLSLNYRGIFIERFLGVIGYIIGFFCFCVTYRWEFVFICGSVIQSIYCIKVTKIFDEPFLKTELFKPTSRIQASLFVADILNKGLVYFDKLILFPLFGGTVVSIYYTANVLGKLILQVTEPIANVILSYLSKKNKISFSLWKMVLLMTGLGCGLMYFVVVFISPSILNLFYPQWAEEALKLVPIVTVSLTISSFISIIYPLVLKSMAVHKQIIINGVSLMCYVLFCLSWYRGYGVYGCCVALLLSYIIKLILMMGLCYWELHINRECI